ncbi:MAG: response regulator [Treponema sp.]|jgi:CheY-like chemotaxis protein|nr:response regulator [Treponema sp.]
MQKKRLNSRLVFSVSIVLISITVLFAGIFTVISVDNLIAQLNKLPLKAVIIGILGLTLFLILVNAPRNSMAAKRISKLDKTPSKPSVVSHAADCFRGKRILLAEDVEINREIVLELLQPASVEIDCAENGKEAVKMFCENSSQYDMIFMDIQMPEMDGYEAARRIRDYEYKLNIDCNARRKIHNNIPIIALSADVFKDDIKKSIESGMNANIGKPLDYNELLGLMHKFLY